MSLTFPNQIETSRLFLRAVSESDLPAMLAMNGDAEVVRYLGHAPWEGIEKAEAWFKRVSAQVTAGTALELVLVSKETGQVIGRCGLFEYEKPDDHAMLGYIMHRAHWRQGYMREALRAFIAHGFDTIGLRRIEARAEGDNVASTGLLKSLGFTQEGILRQRWITEGKPMDAHVFGLLQGEWKSSPRS
ncbi:GNAT family N-acetyltransferase [Brevifollis gellanilyticus]|nr:GNAT family protein [Brevifollis gellanilyticus]